MYGESTGLVWPISLARYAAQKRMERGRPPTPDTVDGVVRELSSELVCYALEKAIGIVEHRARDERPRGGACTHAAYALDQVAFDLRDLLDDLTAPR